MVTQPDDLLALQESILSEVDASRNPSRSSSKTGGPTEWRQAETGDTLIVRFGFRKSSLMKTIKGPDNPT